jgi:regulator of protease activity HflC (stomatin/prohibitin superfamily)
MRSVHWLKASAFNLLALAAPLLATLGCGGATIQPGHRGLLFDPSTGLQHEVLAPGYHPLGASRRIDDFDITYTRRAEPLRVLTAEGLPVELQMSVVYRPIIAELYALDTEIGRGYYDAVVGPETRSAASEVAGHHSFFDFMRRHDALETEIEAETRRRLAGRHVELAGVTLESLKLPPEIVAAVKARLVAEQSMATAKAEAERAKLEAGVQGGP